MAPSLGVGAQCTVHIMQSVVVRPKFSRCLFGIGNVAEHQTVGGAPLFQVPWTRGHRHRHLDGTDIADTARPRIAGRHLIGQRAVQKVECMALRVVAPLQRQPDVVQKVLGYFDVFIPRDLGCIADGDGQREEEGFRWFVSGYLLNK